MKRFGSKVREKLRRLGVAVVYLYGSEALRRPSRFSDVDVGVVFKDKQVLRHRENRARLRLELMRCLESLLAPRGSRELDLVLLQGASPVLQFEAINAGSPLFVADQIFRAEYEASVQREYLDVRPLVEVHYQAALDRAA